VLKLTQPATAPTRRLAHAADGMLCFFCKQNAILLALREEEDDEDDDGRSHGPRAGQPS